VTVTQNEQNQRSDTAKSDGIPATRVDAGGPAAGTVPFWKY
jgi:hypothetical protein